MAASVPIIPGKGIGSLGVLQELLYETMQSIQKSNILFNVTYSEKNCLESPIIITLPSLAVRLLFYTIDHQQLSLIEVLLFDCARFSLNGIDLNTIVYDDDTEEDQNEEAVLCKKKVVSPTLKCVYNKVMGPTFPGKFDAKNSEYTLSYLGITFRFTITLKELLSKLANVANDHQILSILTNWDHAGDITCTSLAVHTEENYGNFLKNLAIQRAPLPNTSLLISKVSVEVDNGVATITYLAAARRGSERLRIGTTTQQDAIRILGPPDSVFHRESTQLRMHNVSLSSAGKSQTNDSIFKFYNYYTHGIDLLFEISPANFNGAVLRKIILHNGGIVESLDFLQWNKCMWELRYSASSLPFSPSRYSEQLFKERLKTVEEVNAGPILFNRNESDFTKDDDLEILHDCRPVVTENDQILKSEGGNGCMKEFKTWGQSMIYGYYRCLFEVLESNGCITRVTIY